MEQHRNPMNAQGYRNILCRHYGRCLDHAVKNNWEFWACSDCQLKEKQQSIDVLLSPRDADPYYSLSPSICKKIEIFSL